MSVQNQNRVQFWQLARLVRKLSFIRDFVIAAAFGIILGAALIISPFVALALVLGLAAGYILLARPMSMIYLLLVAIGLTSGMPRGQLLPFLKPNEAILVLAFGTAFFAVSVAMKRREMPGWVIFASLLLIAGTAIAPMVSFYARGWSLDLSLILRFVAPIQYLILFWIFANLPGNRLQREGILQLIFLMASVVALIGLLQAIGVPFIVNFLDTWYPSDQLDASAAAGRITSVFGAWNVLGTFMMLNLLLLTALQGQKQTIKLYVLNAVVSAILSLFCLIATGSFASILGLIFGYILIKLFEPKGLGTIVPFLLVGVIAAIVLSPFISARLAFQFTGDGSILPRTLVDRFDIWTGIYLPLIEKNPLWGTRPDMEGLTWAFAESEYINLLFRSGLVSLMAHLGWVGIMLAWLRREIRVNHDTARKLAVFMFVMLITLSIMAFTNAVFTYSGTIDYLWIVLGLFVNMRENKTHEQA